MKDKVIAIIPARYQSSRFPGKPLALINGKSLIQTTYDNAKRCSILDEVVVATDDARIHDHVLAFGGKVAMTSPHHLTGTDRIAEVIESNPDFSDASIVLNIQGDHPVLLPTTLEKIVNCLIQDSQAVMSTGATKIASQEDAQNPSIVKCIFDLQGDAIYFSRALLPNPRKGKDMIPGTSYYHHLGIYAFRRDFLLLYANLAPTPLQLAEDLEQLKVIEHGYRIKIAVVEDQTLGVDHPEDIAKVEHYLWKQSFSLSPAA